MPLTPYNTAILDHPKPIGLRRFVVWAWNGVKWPRGGREIRYLTDHLTDGLSDRKDRGRPMTRDLLALLVLGQFITMIYIWSTILSGVL